MNTTTKTERDLADDAVCRFDRELALGEECSSPGPTPTPCVDAPPKYCITPVTEPTVEVVEELAAEPAQLPATGIDLGLVYLALFLVVLATAVLLLRSTVERVKR